MMKSSLAKYLFFIMTLLLWGCEQKSHDHEHNHDHEHPEETGPNQTLYNEVMKVHDEVMPKMGDLYNLKKELEKKIADTPTMSEEKKKEIESIIAKLDSADQGMRDWMHHFNPIPDSVGEEKAREYLEDEMEKVKKVKADILEAMEEAKGAN